MRATQVYLMHLLACAFIAVANFAMTLGYEASWMTEYEEGIASRGTHWTPADIPAGQIKEEPQVPPMYFDRLHGEQASDSDELTTPSMVRRKPPRRPAPLCHPSRDQSGCMILI